MNATATAQRAKGPLVWLDMDQQALDDAYDQMVYAPNRDQVHKRNMFNSDRVRARLLEAEDIVTLAEPDFLVTVSALPSGEVTLSGGQLWSLHNLGIFYGLGRQLAEGSAWPNWYPSAEFRAIRDKSRKGQ